jgi:hypothetical protein
MNKIFNLVRIVTGLIVVFFSFELESTIRPYGSFGPNQMMKLDYLALAIGCVFILEIIINIVSLANKE